MMLLDHVKLFAVSMPRMALQLLFVFGLAVAIAKIGFGLDWYEIGTYSRKYGVKVLVGMFVCYVIIPLRMMTFVNNIINVMAFVTLGVILYRKFLGFRVWLSKLADETLEVLGFWYQLLRNPIRAVSLIIMICALSGSVLGVIVICLLMAVGSNILTKWGLLQQINWADPTTNKVVNGIVVALAISALLSMFGINILGIAKGITSVLMGLAIVCLVIAICVLIYLNKKGDNSSK